jgi:DNA-binding CsgD family transcriptional regulator
VEIHLARKQVTDAGVAADELAAIASGAGSPVLQAMAAHAAGTVRLAEGDATAALSELRVAATGWRRLRMPYEGARTAVALGRACAALGDRAAAALELDGAELVFAELGAQPDLDCVRDLVATTGIGPGVTTSGRAELSGREREVLAEVAAGKTNRQIAASLTISEHTVGRHLENIFGKLGVTSRAAATAYAYEHHLL